MNPKSKDSKPNSTAPKARTFAEVLQPPTTLRRAFDSPIPSDQPKQHLSHDARSTSSSSSGSSRLSSQSQPVTSDSDTSSIASSAKAGSYKLHPVWASHSLKESFTPTSSAQPTKQPPQQPGISATEEKHKESSINPNPPVPTLCTPATSNMHSDGLIQQLMTEIRLSTEVTKTTKGTWQNLDKSVLRLLNLSLPKLQLMLFVDCPASKFTDVIAKMVHGELLSTDYACKVESFAPLDFDYQTLNARVLSRETFQVEWLSSKRDPADRRKTVQLSCADRVRLLKAGTASDYAGFKAVFRVMESYGLDAKVWFAAVRVKQHRNSLAHPKTRPQFWGKLLDTYGSHGLAMRNGAGTEDKEGLLELARSVERWKEVA
ncbi:hypothetical protein BJ508DRAFT_310879 [Ascobolus immersus RN42]|uniref:Uncharacterized protein n=1 Tax=Ascobolus immersus RN42 TaxID=1160509 RepID=A0A3N4HSI5_ASCIM|nr:hypothetical protein BJ508DRAFT_310879 [Ascobolus immersus RN42]